MCVSNMKLYLFTEIEAKEACDWLKAAGFPQYAQLYEGNTQFLNELVFLFHYFFFPSSIPPSSSPPSCGLLQSIFRLQLLHREMGHGKGLFVAAGNCATFRYIFPPFSFDPVYSFPTAFPTFTSLFSSLIWVFVHIVQILTWREDVELHFFFSSLFCSYWSIIHLTICKDSVCFIILFFCLTLWDAFFLYFKICLY